MKLSTITHLIVGLAWVASAPLWSQTIIHGSGQGQSNCTGAGTAAVITDSQPWSNLGFQPTGIPPTSASTVSLHNNLYSSSAAEWPGISLANEVTYLSSGKSTRVLIDSFDCSAGATYAQLAKGSTQYNTHWLPMFSSGGVPSPVAKNVIQSAPFSLTYQFGFFYNIHGEADFGSLNATQYAADIVQWRSDMTGDVNAGNGTSGNSYPVLLHQFSAWNVCTGACGIVNAAAPTMDGTVGGTPSTPIGQWQDAHDYPAAFILSPGYQFTFNPSLTVHYDAYGYIGMGSLMGKQYSDWVANPRRVLYVTPRSVKIVGSTVVVQFWVPTGHLVFDTTTLPAVTAANGQTACYGLEWDNDSNAVTCSSAALSGTGSADGGNDTVTLTLSGAPGTGGVLRSAWTGTAGTQPGGVSGAYSHTNIRDTDTRIAWCADPTVNLCPSIPAQDKNLYDWAVSFQISSFPYAFDPFGVDAKDTVTIYESDGVTRSNIPVVLGRAAKQGDYVANTCPRPEIGGSPLANWQYDAKNTWPDGSAKFGIRSFVVPSLPANGSVTVTFVPDACPSSVPLTQAQMTGFNSGSWGAQIQVTAAATTITRDASTMLSYTDPGVNSFGDCKNDYWLKGPVVTAVIVQDCTHGAAGAGNTTHWDFGWTWNGSTMSTSVDCSASDCGGALSPASLHPWFILYFFPGSNAVRADYILENDWTDRAQNQAIQVDYYTCSGASGCGTTTTKVLGYDGVPRVTAASDITFTANSDAVTSAGGASFAAADVGSSISLGPNAPVTGSTYVDTTICAVTDATHATLCAPPAAGGTGTAAINLWFWGQMYRKTFWSGTGNPGNYLIDHNWPYLVSTQLVPPYDTTRSASPDSTVLSRSDNCNSSPSTGTDFKCMALYGVTGSGQASNITWSDMGDRGGHARLDETFSASDGDPTPMSRESLLYLTNMSTCGTAAGACAKAWLMLTGQHGARDAALVTGSAYSSANAWTGGSGIWNNSGNVTFHIRESRLTAGHYFCPSLAAGQYATAGAGVGNSVAGNSGTCGTSTDTPFGRPFSKYFDSSGSTQAPSGHPAGSQSPFNNVGDWQPLPIRWLEWTYGAYLLTGDYYYALDTQMNGAWAAGAINSTNLDSGSNGIFAYLNPQGAIVRQMAGLLDAVAKAWVVSPDGTVEQKYFDSILASNAEVQEGFMNIQNGVGGFTSTLTPTASQCSFSGATCTTYTTASANRWDWGRYTVASYCGANEPQSGTNCVPVAQALHMIATGQTVSSPNAQGSNRSFTVGYVQSGATTRLISWSGGNSVPDVGDLVYVVGATGSFASINGSFSVTATGTDTSVGCTSSPQGLTGCAFVTINVTTATTGAVTGSAYAIWGSWGKVTTVTSAASAEVTLDTTVQNSGTSMGSYGVGFYGCVDQTPGTNWSGLNTVFTPVNDTGTTFHFSPAYNTSTFPAFSQSGCTFSNSGWKYDQSSDYLQGWMEGLYGVAVNEALNMGVSYFANVASEMNKRIVEKLNNGVTNSTYNPFLIAKNLLPVKPTSGGQPLIANGSANPYYSTWGAVLAALLPQVQTLNTFWPLQAGFYDVGSSPCTDHAYALINRAHAAYAANTTSGSFSGLTGWNWAKDTVPFFGDATTDPGGNCNANESAGVQDQQIKFAFAPLSVPASPSNPPSVSPGNSVRSGNMVATLKP